MHLIDKNTLKDGTLTEHFEGDFSGKVVVMVSSHSQFKTDGLQAVMTSARIKD
jgi:hypothetical protein